MSELEAPGKPELSVKGDIYRFLWPCGIEAELDRFSEHRDELTVELTIRSSRPPRPGLLYSARFNLMSIQARTSLVRALAAREPDLDWGGLVEGLCFLARERYRTGDPSIDMRFYERTQVGRWLVEPFVERAGPTILFADGGTGKSLTALAIAVTAATGTSVIGQLHGDPVPVMYIDYETDADTFEERLDAVLVGAGIRDRPPIFYRRMSASLTESAANLRREITESSIGLVFIDSLGAARAGEPESADVTIRLFNAARSLGVPWLGVDHVTKAIGNDSTRPFGSTYTHNLARLTWAADKAQEEGENLLVVSLTNRKRNNGRLLPRQGHRLEFEMADHDRLRAVRFRAADLTQVAGLAEKLPLRQRILAELRPGPQHLADVAEHLGADVKAVSARAVELARKGVLVKLEDHRYALAAREG
jgi:hypothetical protein